MSSFQMFCEENLKLTSNIKFKVITEIFQLLSHDNTLYSFKVFGKILFLYYIIELSPN